MADNNYELLDVIRRILEKTDEMRILCDKNFNTLYINPPAKKRYPLLNKRINFRDLVEEEDFNRIVSAISIGKSSSAKGRLTKFAYNPPELYAIPIINHDKVLEGCVVNFRNDKIMNNQTEIFDEYRSSVIAAISQEMKYPITMIFTCLDLIKKNLSLEYNNKAKKYFTEITTNCYSLLRYINHMIETVNNESRNDVIKYNEYDICEQINLICTEIDKYTRTQNIDIEVDIPSNNIIFCFDAEKIEKALLNVLTSAVKYTPDGGKITVSIKENEDSVFIFISGVNIKFTENSDIQIMDMDISKMDNKLSVYELNLYYAKSIIMRHSGTFLIRQKDDFNKEIMFKLPKKYLNEFKIRQYEKYTTHDIISQVEKEMIKAGGTKF